MITKDFAYYAPTTLPEAVKIYSDLDNQGQKPIYYAGGTDIINAYQNGLQSGALVDIKGIPECQILQVENDRVISGSAVTLNQIIETNFFPLQSKVLRSMADHTLRNRITLGGSICTASIYRESILPLLLNDCTLVLEGPQGSRTVPINEIYQECIKLKPGEIVTQVIINKNSINLPWSYRRKTRSDQVDFSIVTVAAIKKEQNISFAVSGVCSFPFRIEKSEQVLNGSETIEQWASSAMSSLPTPVINDLRASAGYRQFVLKGVLEEIVQELEVV